MIESILGRAGWTNITQEKEFSNQFLISSTGEYGTQFVFPSWLLKLNRTSFFARFMTIKIFSPSDTIAQPPNTPTTLLLTVSACTSKKKKKVSPAQKLRPFSPSLFLTITYNGNYDPSAAILLRNQTLLDEWAMHQPEIAIINSDDCRAMQRKSDFELW